MERRVVALLWHWGRQAPLLPWRAQEGHPRMDTQRRAVWHQLRVPSNHCSERLACYGWRWMLSRNTTFTIGQGGFAGIQVICKDLAISAELIHEKLSSILPGCSSGHSETFCLVQGILDWFLTAPFFSFSLHSPPLKTKANPQILECLTSGLLH